MHVEPKWIIYDTIDMLQMIIQVEKLIQSSQYSQIIFSVSLFIVIKINACIEKCRTGTY